MARILHRRLSPERVKHTALQGDFQSEAAYVVLMQLREDFATERQKTAVEELTDLVSLPETDAMRDLDQMAFRNAIAST